MMGHSQVETWITAAKRGDRFALAKLLTTCDPRLRARAETRMDAALRVRRGPEDLLQEAYVEIVRQIGQFRGQDLGSFLSWANTMLDRKLIDARRAAHCQARDIDREIPMDVATADSYWNLLDNLYADSGTPSRVVRRQEALSALLASLADLSESHRQVIQSRFVEGLSVAEAAVHLGRSEAAVVALTKRALKTLRRSMDRRGEFTHGV